MTSLTSCCFRQLHTKLLPSKISYISSSPHVRSLSLAAVLRLKTKLTTTVTTKNNKQRQIPISILTYKPDFVLGNFSKYDISAGMKLRLRNAGINCLNEVQYKTYRWICAGTDVSVQARIGTGRTLCFVLPLLEASNEQIKANNQGGDKNRENAKKVQGQCIGSELDANIQENADVIPRRPTILVIVPMKTRAIKISKAFKKFVIRGTRVQCLDGKILDLHNGADILVGTPRCIRDHLGKVDVSKTRHLVLDEANKLIDPRDRYPHDPEDIINIFEHVYARGNNPQTLFFAPAIHQDSKSLRQNYMSSTHMRFSFTSHEKVSCEPHHHTAVINYLINYYHGPGEKVLVHTRTKQAASDLVLRIPNARCIIRERSEEKDEYTLESFKTNKFHVLVTSVSQMDNLDLPEVDLLILTSPVHNIDRPLREIIGKKGKVIVLVASGEDYSLSKLESRIGVMFEEIRNDAGLENIQQSSVTDYGYIDKTIRYKSGSAGPDSRSENQISGVDSRSENQISGVDSGLRQQRSEGYDIPLLSDENGSGRISSDLEPNKVAKDGKEKDLNDFQGVDWNDFFKK